MMTFERVLEVFKEYLAEDNNCEVVITKHGYTVMQCGPMSILWTKKVERLCHFF